MYIDPNTGGMLFQVLAAAFAAVSGLVLILSGRIRMGIARLLRRMKKSATTTPTGKGTADPDGDQNAHS